MITIKINKFLEAFIIILIFNVVCHYIPFLRSSLAPDDYAFLHKEFYGIYNFLKFTQRPLQYLWIDIQNILISDNYIYGTIINLISNLFLIYSVFLVLFILSKNFKYALLITLLIVLFITRIEIYQYPIYIFINIITSIYLLSLFFFILFSKNLKKRYLSLSLIFYIIGILGYEIGILLPIVYFIIFILNNERNYKNLILSFLPFLIILALFIIYRNNNFLQTSEIEHLRKINYDFLKSILEIFHIFAGRYFIKYFIYGIHQFITYNIIYIIILLLINFIVCIFFYKYFKNINIKLEKKFIFIYFLIFTISLIPNFLVGSIAGRNITIALIGILPILIYYLSFIKLKKYYAVLILFIFIIINQGNNFSQIIASNINASLYQYLDKNISEIKNYKYVIIDINSLKKNIKYNLFNNPKNNLNYFFTAHLFEKWGISGMFNKVNNDNNLFRVYVGYSEIIKNNKSYEFYIMNNEDSKILQKEKIILDIKDTFIINYQSLYHKGFKYGKNEN